MASLKSFAEARAAKAFLIDMDGVIYHGEFLLPGAKEFIAWLRGEGKTYRYVTNNSYYTQEELAEKIGAMGIPASPEEFYTSAMATASYCASQTEKPRVWVIGANGMYEALRREGIEVTADRPDYVIMGEASAEYTFDALRTAVNLVLGGARLLGTNADLAGPDSYGLAPATGSMVAPVEKPSGCHAYFLGKPNPLMFRKVLDQLRLHAADAVMIGDSMETDIRGALESGIGTVLVLSGISRRRDLARYAYKPDLIAENIMDVVTKP